MISPGGPRHFAGVAAVTMASASHIRRTKPSGFPLRIYDGSAEQCLIQLLSLSVCMWQRAWREHLCEVQARRCPLKWSQAISMRCFIRVIFSWLLRSFKGSVSRVTCDFTRRSIHPHRFSPTNGHYIMNEPLHHYRLVIRKHYDRKPHAAQCFHIVPPH